MKYKLVFILKCLLMLVFVLVSSYVIYRLPIRENVDLHKTNLEKYKKVMIVAHPDDDILWGGGHLIEDDYLVECITCGSNPRRLNEFKRVAEATNNSYVALGYPDLLIGHKRSEWKYCYDDIYDDVERILLSNDWETIVTYDLAGVYGHLQHKMTARIVTDIYENNNMTTDFYYFGKYYTKKKIGKVIDKLVPLPDDLYKEKMRVLDLYESQRWVKKQFGHMLHYEMWDKYEGEKNEERNET